MTPPELQFHPSKYSRLYLLILHVVVIAVSLTLPLAWCVAALAATAGHFLWHRRNEPLSGALQALTDGRVILRLENREEVITEILPSSLVMAWLLVLHLHSDSGTRHIVLWPDCTDADTFRRWRIWLRWSLPGR